MATIFEKYDEKEEDNVKLFENGGRLLSILNSKQAQKMCVYLLNKATEIAILTAFTFDLLTITDALIAAAVRGIDVSVFADSGHSMSGTTAQQMTRLDNLRSKGVKIHLTRGPAGGSYGIQHSKTLLVDTYLLSGSTNWTNSSRTNHEVDTLVQLTPEGAAAYYEALLSIKSTSRPLTTEEVLQGVNRRVERAARPKSAEPSDRVAYATARRFSIARARSQNRLELK
jgi:phosphatidylserine/phosphatidylglycerophosphate/cardiolipin synthase-like enzyme